VEKESVEILEGVRGVNGTIKKQYSKVQGGREGEE